MTLATTTAGPGESTGASSPSPKKARPVYRPSDSPILYLFILPALLLFVGLYLLPAVNSLRYSLTKWDGIMPSQFVGVENYTKLATGDDLFIKVLGNNLEFMFWVVLFQTGLAFAFALLLVKNTRANVAMRTLLFFPTVLSSVSVGVIWLFLYDPNFGFINNTLNSVGLSRFAANWLGSETTALYAIVFTQVWFHFGQMMVIYIAGLQQIPQELYEAARVDGASTWNTFRSVTWPMAIPTTAVVVAYTTIQSFRAFDLVYTMTGGGPNNSTSILATLIYQTAFFEFKIGYAAAQSVVFVLAIFLVTWVQRRVLRTQYQV
jgi:raffinose/stachyose/melibiose transport system permease protein